MGVNESKIVNEIGVPVFIVTYNCSDTVYWMYREARQVPDNAQPITVDGLAGGNAVKVGVIYNTFVDDCKFVCDLFGVKDGGTLTIQKVTQGSGVTEWSGEAELLIKGKVISLNADLAETVKTILDKLVEVLPVAEEALVKAGYQSTVQHFVIGFIQLVIGLSTSSQPDLDQRGGTPQRGLQAAKKK